MIRIGLGRRQKETFERRPWASRASDPRRSAGDDHPAAAARSWELSQRRKLGITRLGPGAVAGDEPMGTIAEDEARCAQIASLLKALGHPLRLRLVALLCEEPLHVGALAERLGAPQAAVSQQLATLRLHRLVEKEQVEGRAVYHIAEPRLRELVTCMEGCRRT